MTVCCGTWDAGQSFDHLYGSGAAYEIGNEFTPTVNCSFIGVRAWFREPPQGPLASITLWNMDTGANIASQVFNPVAAGYSELLFTTPVTLTGGVTYQVSFCKDDTKTYWENSTEPPSDALIVYTRSLHHGVCGTKPDSVSSGWASINALLCTDVLNACVYGTRLKPGLPALVALSPSVILTIIGKFASSWKSIIASFFAGRLLDTADLCAQLPPPMPEIGPADILALTTYVAFGAHQEIVDKIWTWLQAAAWPSFCECIPGTPDPLKPPDPRPPTTGDPPVYGPFPCDQSDQCAMLTQLLEQQDMIFGYLSMLRSELQALQSQATPFGYTLGTLHTGLTGNGEFAVSAILGLSVQFTDVPLDIGRREDDPITYYGLGEIGLGTDDGWTRSVKTSHNPHLILDIDASITRVSYSLAIGAVANIQELVRHA